MVEAMRVELTPLPTARAVGATNMSMPYSETQRAARSARPRQPCSCSQPQRAAAGAHPWWGRASHGHARSSTARQRALAVALVVRWSSNLFERSRMRGRGLQARCTAGAEHADGRRRFWYFVRSTTRL